MRRLCVVLLPLLLLFLLAAPARAQAPPGCDFCPTKSVDRSTDWLYVVKSSPPLYWCLLRWLLAHAAPVQGLTGKTSFKSNLTTRLPAVKGRSARSR